MVSEDKKTCDVLIVDSGGFIKNAPIRSFADRVITLREVVSEIKDKATKQRLQVLPYELEMKEPDVESIQFITKFSKLSGDFGSLSATDIKVLALAYELEKQLVGSVDHLRSEPSVKPTVNFYKPGEASDETKRNEKMAGFFKPNDDDDEDEDRDHEESGSEDIVEKLDDLSVDQASSSPGQPGVSDGGEEDDISSEYEDDAEDAEGWITPSNIREKKLEMAGLGGKLDKPEHVRVACLTTDFAMQNVLRQIGLNVLSVEGMIIRECKSWILRCYACFATTTLMEKKFCPRCGNQTLKRVSYTLNEDGTKKIHISTRKQITARGKKFPLPAPKGGKHAVNPVLTEDMSNPQQRPTRLARKKTDALAEDYIAGESPFATHDVTSKSARLGITPKGVSTNLYWMKKNPNEPNRKTGNRKKKPRA